MTKNGRRAIAEHNITVIDWHASRRMNELLGVPMMLLDYTNISARLDDGLMCGSSITHFFTLLVGEKKVEIQIAVYDSNKEPDVHNTFFKKVG